MSYPRAPDALAESLLVVTLILRNILHGTPWPENPVIAHRLNLYVCFSDAKACSDYLNSRSKLCAASPGSSTCSTTSNTRSGSMVMPGSNPGA